MAFVVIVVMVVLALLEGGTRGLACITPQGVHDLMGLAVLLREFRQQSPGWWVISKTEKGAKRGGVFLRFNSCCRCWESSLAYNLGTIETALKTSCCCCPAKAGLLDTP